MFSDQIDIKEAELLERAAKVEVTRGSSSDLVELVRAFFTIPEKLLLWDRTVGSGELNEDSEQVMRFFLALHHCNDTHVSINEFNPFLISERIGQNNRVSLLSKLTLGVLEVILYTLTPAKLLGGDYYLPIANTIVINSDNLAIALHEAGHAIDTVEKDRNGLGAGQYSLMRMLPPIMLYQEIAATRKAITFAESCGEETSIKWCWSLLIPAFGTYIAYVINKYVEVNYWLVLISILIACHVLGRVINAVRTARGSYEIDKNLMALVEKFRYRPYQ